MPMTRREWRSAFLGMLSVAAACCSTGCFQVSYCPVRWPSRAFAAPPAPEPFAIALPTPLLSDQAGRVEQDGVTASAELLSPSKAQALFHTDLVRHGVQPLLLALRNTSDQTYLFQRSQIGGGALPAARVAEWAYVHPVRRAAQYAKWLVWWTPGVIFEAFIEPATTFDFPGIEAAARRPAPSQRAQILQEFTRHELGDAALPPNGSLVGVVFIPPPTLGHTIALTLVNTRTQQPLVLQLPTPAPIYTDHRVYASPKAVVWDAAIRAIGTVGSWTIVSRNADGGTLQVRKSGGMLGRPHAMDITMALQVVNDHETDLVVQGARWQPRRADDLDHSRTIDRFFETLDGVLPKFTPPAEEFATEKSIGAAPVLQTP